MGLAEGVFSASSVFATLAWLQGDENGRAAVTSRGLAPDLLSYAIIGTGGAGKSSAFPWQNQKSMLYHWLPADRARAWRGAE